MTDNTAAYIRSLEHENATLRRHWKGTHPEVDAAAKQTKTTKDALVHELHGDIPIMPPQPLRYTTFVSPTGKTETMLIVTLYGVNRHLEVTEWNKRVMVDHFGIQVNYLNAPFPGVSHGACMNQLLAQTVDSPSAPDYYLFNDNDSIFLRRETLTWIYGVVNNGLTVLGPSWQSNHKQGPNGQIAHPYASQATLCFPASIYRALGRPDMDHFVPRSDTGEELTYAAKAAGYNVSLLYPSYSIEANTPLDNGMTYGMGNTYGPLTRPLMHHASQTGHPCHVEVFVETCKMVLANAFEGDNPALPYGYIKPV